MGDSKADGAGALRQHDRLHPGQPAAPLFHEVEQGGRLSHGCVVREPGPYCASRSLASDRGGGRIPGAWEVPAQTPRGGRPNESTPPTLP
jgi:hypothetical protein